MKITSIVLILASLAVVSALDSEFCALNLNTDDCLKNSGLKNCCWLNFMHANSFVGEPINGCFDLKFMVNSMKFLISPQTYDKMTDA